jgi:phosphoenolpyruvate carboxykinase (GTP)
VIAWCFDRIDGKVKGVKTPIGILPDEDAFNLSGLKIDSSQKGRLFHINEGVWRHEIEELEDYFSLFDPELPKEFQTEIDRILQELS